MTPQISTEQISAEQISAVCRRSLFTGLLAIGIFIALHPIVIEYFSSRFLGGAVGDGGLYVWLVQSFINDPWKALAFESNTLYPYPLTRAWSDPFFVPAFIALLFTKVGLSLPAAYNSVILLTFASNAVTCALLAQRVGLAPSFAVSVGVLFANSSYIVGNLGHPQLMFFFWIPLAWWCVLAPAPHQRATSRSWCIAGFCIAGAFFCAVYYAIFAAIGLAIIWFRDLLYGRLSSRRALRTVLFATIGAAPVIYALPPFFSIQHYFGTRGLHEADHFAATGLSYLSFSQRHDIFGFSAQLSHSEANLSPGYLVTLLAAATIAASCLRRSRVLALATFLAAAALLISSSVIDQSDHSERLICISSWVLLIASLAYTLRTRSALGSFIVIACVFFIFSFGPGGNPHKHEPSFSPLGLLFAKVPGLAAVRAVGRYGSVVVLAAFITAALGLQGYVSSTRRRLLEVPQVALASLFVILGLVDNLVTTIPFDAPSPPVQAFRTLATDLHADGAALILPFSQIETSEQSSAWSQVALLNSAYALWESETSPHKISLANGYSGQRSKIQVQLPRATRNFPDDVALDYFARICGLRYIIVVPDLYQNWNEVEFSQRLQKFSAAFSSVQRFEDRSILLTLKKRAVRIDSRTTPPSSAPHSSAPHSSAPHSSALHSSAPHSLAPPFLAPRNRPIHLEFTPDSSEQCSVTATSLGKSVAGLPIALQSSEYTISHRLNITLPDPTTLSAASPHIIELKPTAGTSTVPCSVLVGCEVGG
jgi:hypothetical protein